MSKFSGKCDFYDSIMIHGLPRILSSDIYIGDNIIPLRIDTEKDCIPYYPYLVSTSAMNKEGKSTIVLTSRSYVDINEEEQLNNTLKTVLRIYNRCKRNHVPFDEEITLNQMKFLVTEDYERELVHRVALYGNKATISDIHKPFHNYYRDLLFDEMISNGYDKQRAYYWVYKKFKSFKGE